MNILDNYYGGIIMSSTRRARARQQRKVRSRMIFLLVLIMAIFVSFVAVYYGLEKGISTVNGTGSKSKATIHPSKIKTKDIYSENVILIDAENGDELYEKNGHDRTYPASLTKIMTVLLAIEENKNLDKTTYITSYTISKLTAENASMAGYNANERTSIKDLLYGSMLASGAEASIGLAQFTSGSVDNFVELMNDKAHDLGMKDTHFTNVTGLHDDNHYTTANDVAILLKYALENPTFREVFTAKSHNIKTDNREFTVHSTFFPEYNGKLKDGMVLGAKTGTTVAAGSCLASCVTIDGHDYILVTTNAPIGESVQPFSFDDLDYIFTRLA